MRGRPLTAGDSVEAVCRLATYLGVFPSYVIMSTVAVWMVIIMVVLAARVIYE